LQVDSVNIYLLRHGEVDFPKGLFYGQMDIPLSEEGKRQSLLAARQIVLRGVDFVISSDLRRCSYLAGLIREEGGPAPEFSRALREVDFGRWAGLSWEDIERQYPGAMARRMNDLASYRPPAGECLMDVLDRTRKVFRQCARGLYGQKVAIVAHGGVNRVLIADFLRLKLQNVFSLHQDYTCINCIEFFPDGNGVLRFLNMTHHLDAAVQH
jgi:broad specificity phosphatase PhoE